MKNRILILSILAIGVGSVVAGCAAKSVAAERPSPYAQAPTFTGGPWLNTADGRRITLADRKGKPTLVAFWTFACSNCQNNFAPYARLLQKFRAKGVEMISVHTPEMDVEKDLGNVEGHVKKFKIDYPVLVDGKGENWQRWHQQFWPTLYVIDGAGRIRFKWEGELNYNGSGGEDKVAAILQELLAEQE